MKFRSSLFRRSRPFQLAAACAALSPFLNAATAPDMAAAFAAPPKEARPWVWAHWLHGNVSKESITRDLEAIQRVGLGGVTLFDVAQPGIPPGPNKYMDERWQALFAWEIAEASRLGLEVMSQNGPGYSGNGGPWITPELGSQKIVTSDVRVKGGTKFSGFLPQPESNGGFYRDVAVLALRETEEQGKPHIENLDMKRLVWLNFIKWAGVKSAPPGAVVPAELCLPRSHIVDVTKAMDRDGRFEWLAPEGTWTVLRCGHTWTGQKTLPATPEGSGPECDKLDPRGIRAHFQHVMRRMVELGGDKTGKVFHSFFVDSWEAGGQNWTERMPAEFRRRRGYDPIPFLPIMTGRVIADLQTSERFLYDLRQTVSELVTEHFWAELQRLCNAVGMRLAVQPYITTGNDFDAADFADEPCGEYWTAGISPVDYRHTIKAAASAANLNGRIVVGIEAMTASATERWQSHPGMLKTHADQIFCLGGNRIQFHRFAMQRFAQLRPGMMMGGWGQQYDRTQTWWEWTQPWHDYLARCQFMLRQGPIVADVLVAASEEPLGRFEPTPIAGFDYDACGPNVFARLRADDGQVITPKGPRYRLLVVRHDGMMTLARLRQLRHLLENGATVLCERPVTIPGLEGGAEAERELQRMAQALWGDGTQKERAIGRGRLYQRLTSEAVLQRMGLKPDFESDPEVTWIHRRGPHADIYFVAARQATATTRPCRFRVSGRAAELWDPEMGSIQKIDTKATPDGRVEALMPLGPDGSAFVVFRDGPRPLPEVRGVLREGRRVFPCEKTLGAPEELPVVSVRDGGDHRLITVRETGRYAVSLSDGTTVALPDVAVSPKLPILGPWHVHFPEESGAPAELVLERLQSWTEHPNKAVKHFSGTATYRTRFQLPDPTGPVELSLGRLEVMARVRVNGTDMGILWKAPHAIDISKAVRAGDNTLEIAVVNLWVNRLIGDAALPEDALRDARGLLLEWPEWVLAGRTSPTGRQSFVTFPLWKKHEPLKESGLLGPVLLTFPKHLRIPVPPSRIR